MSSNRRCLETLLLSLLVLMACGPRSEKPASVDGPDAEVGAKTYVLSGRIVDRNEAANTLTIDHEAIGDWMDAMTMRFPVRGAKVADLPSDGTPITAVVHVNEDNYWIRDVAAVTDVEPMEFQEPASGETTPPAEP